MALIWKPTALCRHLRWLVEKQVQVMYLIPGHRACEAGLRPGLGFWRPASHLSMEDSGTGINSKCQRFFLEPITPAQYQDIECADWPLGTDTAHPLQLLTWFLALGSSYRKVECLAKKPMCLLLPPLREAWPLTPKNRTEQLP